MKTEIVLEPLERAHEGYGRAIGKLRELQATLAAVEREDQAIEAQLREMPPRQRAIEAAAMRLVGGEDSEASKREEDLRRELGAMRDRKAVLRRAVEIAEQEVKAQIHAARQVVTDKVRPMAAEISTRVIKALIMLGEEVEQAAALCAALSDVEVNPHGVFLPLIGWIDVEPNGLPSHGNIANFLYDAIEAGAMKVSDLPPSWRERWEPRRAFRTPADVEREQREQLERSQAATKAEEDRLAKASAGSSRRRRR